MNAKDLTAFLSGDIPARELQTLINAEVATYAKLISMGGRSAPVILNGMAYAVDITPQRALILLDAYIEDDLPAASFSYILDALLLEERFQWNSLHLRDCMEKILEDDPAKMDKEWAKQVRAEILNSTDQNERTRK